MFLTEIKGYIISLTLILSKGEKLAWAGIVQFYFIFWNIILL
jgi:hypothetical protein